MNKCINCNKSNFVDIFKTSKFPLFFGATPLENLNKIKYYPLKISKCRNCDLVQQVNLLNQNIINSIYTADYYNCSSTTTSGLLKKEKHFFVDFLQSGKIKKGNVLEIACYDGYVLNLLKKDGWKVYGCDPNPMVKFAQKNLGKKFILKKMFTKKSFGSKKFDIIFFRNLLEHLYDTSKFLKIVKSKLTSNGSIYIEVPNIYNILDGSVFGSFFHQHISYFSIETLEYLLNKNGFKIERYYAGDFLIVEAKNNNFVNAKPINRKKINRYMKSYKSTYVSYTSKLKNFFEDPKNKNICLFGASSQSTSIINILKERYKEKIKYIIDNDVSKIGNYMVGTNVKISSPKNLLNKNLDCILIMSFMYFEEMKKNLLDLGISEKKIKSLYA
tara:strand:- start:1044 stop:2201 length:1158 start_codon:yes stop_codon:yes gene_type:complete